MKINADANNANANHKVRNVPGKTRLLGRRDSPTALTSPPMFAMFTFASSPSTSTLLVP